MTNKPQSDMPDVIYAQRIKSYESCCQFGCLEVWGDSDNKDGSTKYISEQSHLAALAELEAKHREEMLALVDEIYNVMTENTPLYLQQKAINSIKQRIGDSHD